MSIPLAGGLQLTLHEPVLGTLQNFTLPCESPTDTVVCVCACTPIVTINFTSLNERFSASGVGLSQQEWEASLTLSLSSSSLFCWADLEFSSSKMIC